MKTRKPYRLSRRAELSPESPFTVEQVGTMLAEALRGPKTGRTTHAEPNTEAVRLLSSILNNRHQLYFAAQQDRARKDRRDRAKALIDKLRGLMPAIVKDAEQQIIGNEVFSRSAFVAASALHEVLSSDVPIRALPQVTLPENVFGWQWCARSLFEDIRPLIGANAAMRFLTAAIPFLSGERPSLPSVQAYLKQKQAG